MPTHLIFLKDGATKASASRLWNDLFSVLKRKNEAYELTILDPEIPVWRLDVSSDMTDTVATVCSMSRIVPTRYIIHDETDSEQEDGSKVDNKKKTLKAKEDGVQMYMTSDSTLLSLPAEMRNRIYRFALVEEDPLVMTPNAYPPSEPALLRTCRQIRHEAIAIYYTENEFEFEIQNNDASELIKWYTGSKHRESAQVTFVVQGSRNWTNLVEWVKDYSAGKAPGFNLNEDEPPEKGCVGDVRLG